MSKVTRIDIYKLQKQFPRCNVTEAADGGAWISFPCEGVGMSQADSDAAMQKLQEMCDADPELAARIERIYADYASQFDGGSEHG